MHVAEPLAVEAVEGPEDGVGAGHPHEQHHIRLACICGFLSRAGAGDDADVRVCSLADSGGGLASLGLAQANDRDMVKVRSGERIYGFRDRFYWGQAASDCFGIEAEARTGATP